MSPISTKQTNTCDLKSSNTKKTTTYIGNRGPDLEQAINMADLNGLMGFYKDSLPLNTYTCTCTITRIPLFNLLQAEFIKTKNTDTKAIHFTFMHIADVLLINNPTLLCVFH